MLRKQGYKTDLTDDEWHFTAQYLAIIPLESPQRKYDAREVLNAIRYMVKTGVQYEYLPHEFPPPEIVKAQLKRWIDHHCFLIPRRTFLPLKAAPYGLGALTGGIAGKSFSSNHNVG